MRLQELVDTALAAESQGHAAANLALSLLGELV
jgi:hypothetical protein